MPLRNAPIRRKLMTVILLTSGVVVLLTCGAFVTYEVITLRKGMVRGLTTRAEIIAANSTAALAFGIPTDAAEVLSALRKDVRTVAGCIYDKEGHLFAKYPADALDDTFPPQAEKPGHRFGPSELEIFTPVIQGDRDLGTVYIKTNLSALTERYRAYGLLAATVFIGSILVAYLLSRALQRQISQPILALAETAKAISNHRDFSVRAVKLSHDELGLLTDAFNDMLGEIHKLNSTLEQRVRERTAELESVNKELEAFSYSVSHDLRAPLRHISGFANLLTQSSAAQLGDGGKRQLGIITDAAKRMGTLIDDLLVFSRIGRATMRRDHLKMDELVAEARQEMAADLEGRNIDWEISALPEVYGDRSLLKQVWVNLLSNAVKYSRDRNPAQIKVAGRKNDRGEWEFSVADNGAGFDMQYVNKLFGVFQRLHMAEEFEGTGIGLANVQRIILRHGGRVWAEGAVDAGATFRFTLPDVERTKP